MVKIHENMEDTKGNMEKGNEQLEIKADRDNKSNKCLIGAVFAVFIFICFLIWIAF